MAAEIRRVQSAYGPDSVAVFGGGGLTNEKAYALGKFARVALGTSNIDYNGRFCMSSAAAAGTRAFGIDRGLPFPLPDLAAADAILLVGSNVAETMPPFMRWLSDQQDRRRRADRGRSAADADGPAATLHLQSRPGPTWRSRTGCCTSRSPRPVDDRTSPRGLGIRQVRRVAAAYWPERVERITG